MRRPSSIDRDERGAAAVNSSGPAVPQVRRKNRRNPDLAKYEALLTQQGDDEIIAAFEALLLAVAQELRRRDAVGTRSATRRTGGVR